MKKILDFIVLMAAVYSLSATAQQRQYLHDGWTFGQTRLPNQYPAMVPGVVHTDLIRQGIIDDPYVALNERSVQWIDKEDWVYETTFRPSSFDSHSSSINLCFDGLDTYADVYLNDSLVIKADNMFRRWRTDITSLLRADADNHLRVYFHSPVKVDMPKWEKVPKLYRGANDQSENGGLLDRQLSVFARKAGYHYGWDWGPRLVTSGIWRDVYLEAWTDARIADVHLRQHEVNAKKANLTDVVTIEAAAEVADALVTVTDESTGRIVATKRCSLAKGTNTIPVEFTIKNPRLWWCKGLGKPELYTFATSISAGSKELCRQQNRIGLRSVQLVTEPDDAGLRQFYFVLNGVKVFAKGTNYIPQDNFLTNVTPERYRQTLQDAVDANMNMIRVWGGGIYENDIFYDLCDEMGLMVWQDFMFACSTYPAEGEWLESVREEATDNVRRLRNHPSIVIWCGGNECTDAWYNWGWKGRMEKTNPEAARVIGEQQERLYYNVLREVTDREVPNDIYTVGSPFSVRGHGSDGENGDRHFYGVGHRRMPVSAYNQEKAHFFSEYGMQSFPEMATIHRFAPDAKTHDITSELMMWHQRGGVEANKVIEWYVESEYGHPHDFQQFVYASQLLQGDAMRTAIEAHRRDMPHCWGSLLWQHDDCWPVASWATRDYYGRWKAAHYMVRHAFEPLLCSAITEGDSVRLYAVSDLQQQQRGELCIAVYTLDGQRVNDIVRKVNIPANTSTLLFAFPVDELIKGLKREDVVLHLTLSADRQKNRTSSVKSVSTYESNAFLCLSKDLHLADVNPEVEVTPDEGGCKVTLKAGKFVRALCLSIEGEEAGDQLGENGQLNITRLSDNYIDLLPGVPAEIHVATDLSPAELKARLRIRSLCELER